MKIKTAMLLLTFLSTFLSKLLSTFHLKPLLKQSLLALPILLFSVSVFAGAGHDHGEEASTTANPNKPHRLPDGSVFLPKATQRFIKLRTQITKNESLSETFKLNGRVVMGEKAIGKVRALQAGRLQFAGNKVPAIGDFVNKGKHLATITLITDAQEGTVQAAEVAQLREQLKHAQLEYHRLNGLGNLIPRQETDAANATVRGIRARIGALSKGSKAKQEAMHIPISGIVTGSYVSNKQAVQAGDLILELLDPNNFQIEALSFDPALAKNIASANMFIDNKKIALTYQGTSRRLRLQALPLRFSVKNNKLSNLAEGLPVQVFILTKNKQKGIAVPADALARNASNQTIVWVKTAPEQYASRVVQYKALDGERVLITAGLKSDERVVVQATTLLNQIR